MAFYTLTSDKTQAGFSLGSTVIYSGNNHLSDNWLCEITHLEGYGTIGIRLIEGPLAKRFKIYSVPESRLILADPASESIRQMILQLE